MKYSTKSKLFNFFKVKKWSCFVKYNFPLFEQQNLMFLLYHEQNILLSGNKYLMFAQTVTRARIMKIPPPKGGGLHVSLLFFNNENVLSSLLPIILIHNR